MKCRGAIGVDSQEVAKESVAIIPSSIMEHLLHNVACKFVLSQFKGICTQLRYSHAKGGGTAEGSRTAEGSWQNKNKKRSGEMLELQSNQSIKKLLEYNHLDKITDI